MGSVGTISDGIFLTPCANFPSGKFAHGIKLLLSQHLDSKLLCFIEFGAWRVTCNNKISFFTHALAYKATTCCNSLYRLVACHTAERPSKHHCFIAKWMIGHNGSALSFFYDHTPLLKRLHLGNTSIEAFFCTELKLNINIIYQLTLVLTILQAPLPWRDFVYAF